MRTPLIAAFLLGLPFVARSEWKLEFRREIAPLANGAVFVEREARREGRAVRIQGVVFPAKSARLAVLDNANGRSLGEAMIAAGAIAGTNGAYFHADNTPLGLVIADGKKLHGFERAKLLSGILVVTKGRPRLVRSAKYTPSTGDTEALQAGPFLVEGNAPIAGLNSARAARRTVVATDGSGRWALLLMSGVTLADAAQILSTGSIWPDFPIAQALNLDGGSSSGLWVNTPPKPFYAREFATVRNCLVILPRN